MDNTNLALYTSTLLLAVASPGPAIAAIVGFVLANGVKGAFAFIGGIIFAECFWLAASIFGVEAIFKQYPYAMLVLRFIGIAFLCHMAFQMWQSADKAFESREIRNEPPVKLFIAGVVLSISNPKTMIFYVTLLPNLIAEQNLGTGGYLVYMAIMLAVTSGVFASYALLANQARAFLQDASALKRVKQMNAILLILVAIAILNLTLKAL